MRLGPLQYLSIMDPLSIAAAASSLAAFAFRLSRSLYGYIEEVKDINSTLSIFHSEVSALSQALDSVGSCFRDPRLGAFQGNLHRHANLFSGIETLLEDCKSTLKTLDDILRGIQKPGLFGKLGLQKPIAALKQSLKSADLLLIRQQLQSYCNAMQMSLQMVNICLALDNRSSAEALGTGLNESLESLQRGMTAMQTALNQSREKASASNNLEIITVREYETKAENIRDYVNSARTIYSAASEYYGSETATINGSRGEIGILSHDSTVAPAISHELKLSIRNWIPATDFNEGLTPESSDDDIDEDFELALALRLQKLGEERFGNKDFAQAETFFTKCLANLRLSSASTAREEELVELELNLAFSYCGQHKYPAAQELLLSLSERDNISQTQVCHILHCLAEAHLLDNGPENAMPYCQSAVKARQKLFGKRHELFYQSVSLQSEICDALGEHAEAEAYRTFLPPGFIRDSIPGQVSGIASNIPKEKRYRDTRDQDDMIKKATDDKENLKMLSKKGFDLRSSTSRNEALIWVADSPKIVGTSSEAVARLLLENGADVDATDDGATALVLAAYSGHTAMVDVLLENGANIRAKNKHGYTALHWAANRGHVVLARSLVEKGPDIEARNKHGYTALHCAACKGHVAIVELLLDKRANMEARTDSGVVALICATFNGHPAVVEILLRNDPDIEAKNNYGWTALIWAADKGHVAIVKLLLEKGANIEARTESGELALLRAARSGHMAVIELLLQNGANFEAKDKYRWTALIWAADKGHMAVAKLLLEKGADIQGRDENGKTALTHAKSKRRADIVRLLERALKGKR